MARWRAGIYPLVNWGVSDPMQTIIYCVLPNNFVILGFAQRKQSFVGEQYRPHYVYMGFKASDKFTREEITLYQALGFKTCGGRWLEYQQGWLTRHIRHIHQFERKSKLHKIDDYFNYKELQ